MNHDVIIIGGGAAGLTAAITLKDLGIDAAILEGNDRIGKKILTTGNGRCNITNNSIDKLIASQDSNNFSRYHSENPNSYIPVLKAFTVEDTIRFFSNLGLPLTTLEEGKMYPLSLQASSVLDIFRMTLSEKNIPVYTRHKVTSISKNKTAFKITCSTEDGERVFQCNKIILCTGGKSAASTGSDGSGYSLAKALGHSIIPPIPALVQLKLDYKNLRALSGIKFDGSAEILVNEAVQRKELGEILFTDYGISGPPILQLSRIAAYNLKNKKAVTIKVDMFNSISKEELENFLESHWAVFSYRSVHDSFIGVINKKLIPIILKEAGINDIHKPCWNLQWNEKRALYSFLKEWQFTVTDTNSFANAQVTAGGVDTSEVDSRTLESKLISGLYFAGEVLDVDGDCGGYNLQWAWSSGYVAAISCSKN